MRESIGLDELMDCLYTPPDHELPAGMSPDQLRRYPTSHYELRLTNAKTTEKGHQKPNSGVLSDIIASVGASADQVAYVGDNLVKDVSMAQDAGVHDVWAKYGEAHSREEYELLRSVTHWSDEMVQRERRTNAGTVKPTFILRESFGELTELFEFTKWQSKTKYRTWRSPGLKTGRGRVGCVEDDG